MLRARNGDVESRRGGGRTERGVGGIGFPWSPWSYLISVIFVEVKRALVKMVTLVTFYSPAKRYVCQGGEGLGQA